MQRAGHGQREIASGGIAGSMLERLLSFLKELPGGAAGEGLSADDPKVAVAALMFHVIDADGVREGDEVARLRQTIAGAYGLSGEELDEVLRAGETAERDAVDLYAFTSVVMRHLDQPARARLIELLWEMVYADGERHELEDNIVWRVSELVGIDGHERVALRRKVATRHGVNGSFD